MDTQRLTWRLERSVGPHFAGASHFAGDRAGVGARWGIGVEGSRGGVGGGGMARQVAGYRLNESPA
jgi:hypothetical protein